ncbi:MAG: YhdH/YhfP family quinone oxidoreductase [bacterium]|jgi:putative YhdH/YhfP family quinone oxidoreductase|nr:YhdH/YhfP family quinone oxidoreductase [Betaproteobacteria bacterium]
MSRFKAVRVSQGADKATSSALVETTIDELSAGDVVIASRFASINYKDALAVTGRGRIMSRFPCIAGIDVAGVVESSSDARFKPGDAVFVNGFGLGVSHDGGFSERVRVPADWVIPVPQGMTLLDVATMGVAGFTVALAIHLMELNGLAPGGGRVLVNGATGGCGSIGIDMLARRGYQVVALTGKPSSRNYLMDLGASEVLVRGEFEMGSKALEKSQFAGALDSVGGEQLSWLTRSMMENGVIGAFGNAGGADLATSVFPFILRGVRLIGVNSNATMAVRQQVWARVATDLRPRHLDRVGFPITIDQVVEHCTRSVDGKVQGRAIVHYG